MSGFWKQIKELFKQAEAGSPSNPTVHELIERSPAEKADYESWKKTLAKQRLLNWLMDQYAIHQVGGRLDSAIDFLNTPSSKGFVIHFHETNYSEREVTHFFHYLKEQVQALEYRLQISDRRIFPRANWVESQEKHYLKPRNKYVEGELINQRFGNITIELEKRNDRIHNLRLRATVYNDANYSEAASFDSLIGRL